MDKNIHNLFSSLNPVIWHMVNRIVEARQVDLVHISEDRQVFKTLVQTFLLLTLQYSVSFPTK